MDIQNPAPYRFTTGAEAQSRGVGDIIIDPFTAHNDYVTGSRQDGFEYGFIARRLKSQLLDVGNWRARADALQELQQVVAGIERYSVQDIDLAGFIQFLISLVSDPNFKISRTSSQIMGEIIQKLGHNLHPHISTIVPAMVETLGDVKARQEHTKIIRKLMTMSRSPYSILDLILPVLSSDTQRHRNVKIREEVLNIAINSIMEFPLSREDAKKITSHFVKGMEDADENIRDLSLEAIALVYNQLGSQLEDILKRNLNVTGTLRDTIQRRLEQEFAPQDSSHPDAQHYQHTSPTQENELMNHNASPARVNSFKISPMKHGMDDCRPAQKLNNTSPAFSTSMPSQQQGAEGRHHQLGDDGAATGSYEEITVPDRSGSRSRNSTRQIKEIPWEVPEPRARSRQGRMYGASSRRPSGTEFTNSSSEERSAFPREQIEPAASLAPASEKMSHSVVEEEEKCMRRSVSKKALFLSHDSEDGKMPSLKQSGHDDYGGEKVSLWLPSNKTEAPHTPAATVPESGTINAATGTPPKGMTFPTTYKAMLQNQRSTKHNKTSIVTPMVAMEETSRSHDSKESGSVLSSLRLLSRGRSDVDREQNGTRRPETVSSSGHHLGSPMASADSGGVAGKLSILKRRALSRRAHSAGSIVPTTSRPIDAEADNSSLNVEIPSPPAVPKNASQYNARRKTVENDPMSADAPRSSTGGVLGGYSPSVWNSHRQGLTTPPVSHADSSGDLDAITPNTRNRLRGMQESAASPFAEIPTESLPPVDNPEASFRTAVAALGVAAAANHKDLDWGAQYESLIELRKLCAHHKSVVVSNGIHSIVLGIKSAIVSLRSHVAKTALILVMEMFVFLPCKTMEAELEHLAPALLKRSAQSDFLAVVAKKALAEMVTKLSEMRTCSVLLGNVKHTNPNVRTAVAQTICLATEAFVRARDNFSATTSRDMYDRLFQFSVGALEEGNPDARAAGRKVLCILFRYQSTPGEFDNIIRRLPDSKKRSVTKAVDNADRILSETRSSVPTKRRSRRSSVKPEASARTADSAEAAADLGGEDLRRTKSDGTSAQSTADSLQLNMLYAILSRMETMEWRGRVDALSELVDAISQMAPRGLLNDQMLVNIFDHLVKRLTDGNSKVVLHALLAINKIFPVLGDSSCVALNGLMPALASSLSSTNEKIRLLASSAIDTLIASASNCLLLQNFTHCISHGATRGKHIMVDKLTTIIGQVYNEKPATILRYALPACFALLNASAVDVRNSTSRLARELAVHVGKDTMLDNARSLSSATQTQKLTEILAHS